MENQPPTLDPLQVTRPARPSPCHDDVIDVVQLQFEAPRTVGNERTRKAARIDIERGMPRMVYPWRPGKAVFADDLSIKMQSGKVSCQAP